MPPVNPAFGVLPCPCPPPRRGRLRQVEPATKTATPQPGAANARRASEAGQAPPPARDTPLLRCRPTGRQGTAPRAAFVRPAPGERTISNAEVPLPGPPSPWLPALPIERLFYRFCGEPQVQPRGCKGLRPLHEITLVSPFPAGEGGRGDRGQLKAG